MVGGGGAGSTGNAGGGGAGGMIEITSSTRNFGTYPVTIGTPGPHPGATGTKGSPGGPSTFGPGLTAYGGGAGGRDGQSADDGGSGGGAGYNVGRGNPSQIGFPIPGSYSGAIMETMVGTPRITCLSLWWRRRCWRSGRTSISSISSS